MVRAAPPMTSRNSVAKGHSREDRRLAPLRTSPRRSARRNCSGGVARNGNPATPCRQHPTRDPLQTIQSAADRPALRKPRSRHAQPLYGTWCGRLRIHSLFFILRIRDRQVPELLAVVRNGDSSPQSDSASVHHHVEFSSCIRKGVCPYSFSNPSSF